MATKFRSATKRRDVPKSDISLSGHPKSLTQKSRSKIRLHRLVRHARPCAGHPRPCFNWPRKTWMAGTKPGHDGKRVIFKPLGKACKTLVPFRSYSQDEGLQIPHGEERGKAARLEP